MFRRLGNLENVNSPLLFLDFIFKVVYSLRGVNLKSNRLSAQGFYKNLHCHNDGRKRDVVSERDRSSIYNIGSVRVVIAVRGFYEAQAQKPGNNTFVFAPVTTLFCLFLGERFERATEGPYSVLSSIFYTYSKRLASWLSRVNGPCERSEAAGLTRYRVCMIHGVPNTLPLTTQGGTSGRLIANSLKNIFSEFQIPKCSGRRVMGRGVGPGHPRVQGMSHVRFL